MLFTSTVFTSKFMCVRTYIHARAHDTRKLNTCCSSLTCRRRNYIVEVVTARLSLPRRDLFRNVSCKTYSGGESPRFENCSTNVEIWHAHRWRNRWAKRSAEWYAHSNGPGINTWVFPLSSHIVFLWRSYLPPSHRRSDYM